jgi:phage gp36-like protein
MESDTAPRVGRRAKNFVEQMVARFREGTFARIAAALRSDETRTDFVQEAVEAELKRREGGR